MTTTFHGRTPAEWDELASATEGFLIERARMERTTSYTELNTVLTQRTDAPTFDFDRADERAAMGELLGRVTDASMANLGVMLSAIVLYLDANDAGSGFYGKARDLGLLQSTATAQQREAFWVQQVAAVYAAYRRESRLS